MLKPLWEQSNTSLFSSVFNVPPGQVCILFADGLELWKVRSDASEVVVPQTICVRKMLHSFDGIKPDIDRCGWVFSVDSVRTNKIVDSLVQTCGLPWQLTACRNIGIIGVPGHYRLELNDSTAIGTAQVYAELYDTKSIPLQVQSLFF